MQTKITTDENSASKMGPVLVIFALTFNLILCFVQTRRWLTVSNSEIVVCELGIMLVGLLMIWRRVSDNDVRISGVIMAYLIGIKLINPGLDLKILHDIAIIYIFYSLGRMYSVEVGNRLLWIAMAIVLVFGLFELLLPNFFGNVFDIWNYYVSKGSIDQDTVNYSQTSFFLSGARAGGMSRTFLPGLFGPHRVSSVFLEPVSLGNFAAIAFAWCLSTPVGKLTGRIVLICLSLFCIVLPDSRFGFGCCMFMLMLRVSALVDSKFVVFLLPVLVLSVLTLVGSIHEMPGFLPKIWEDDLSGRLLFSARLLDYWDIQQWLGLAASPVYTSDTGYAYVINNLGLPLTLFLLAIFAAHPCKSKEAQVMKAMISVYYTTSLCVGASLFSIKTAALLWFLYGVTNAANERYSNYYLMPRRGVPGFADSFNP